MFVFPKHCMETEVFFNGFYQEPAILSELKDNLSNGTISQISDIIFHCYLLRGKFESRHYSMLLNQQKIVIRNTFTYLGLYITPKGIPFALNEKL